MHTTLEHLFHQVLDMPTQDRMRYLQTECPDGSPMRAELESLLDAALSGDACLREAIGAAASTLMPATGTMVGPYRLLEPIGEGGMGVVFLAERADGQFDQQVAIKFVQGGASAVARFQQEQQILARLVHPNIARLIDGGLTANGNPYMVMEYFPGEPLSRYCRNHQLTVAEKLKLFLQVCSAVDYAHRNLVIHRDLKPSNILVNEQGELKLLDFGIAKLVHRPADEQCTAPGCSFFTPDYASPEQVRGEPVTTAADVYSLGAVLYELLRGTGPHKLSTYSPAEITQVVCLDPPPGLGLGNELDQIVQMALRKESDRRYPSVAQFAEDIGRFLANRPVHAQGDSLRYRCRKFLRRNAVPVIAAALAIASLVSGLGVALWQARVARWEAAQAQHRFEQVRKLAHTVLFDLDDLVRPVSGAIAARELLAKTAVEYLDSLYADARNDNSIGRELAIAYERVADVQGEAGKPHLGQPINAIRNYRRSVEMWEQLPETERDPQAYPRALLKLHNEVGGPYLERARSAAERRLQTSPNAPDLYAILIRLERVSANDLLPELRFDEALVHLRRALVYAEKWHAQDPGPRSLDFLSGVVEALGRYQLRAGHPALAVQSLDRALAMRRQLLASDPTNVRHALSVLQLEVMRGDALSSREYLHLNRPAEAAFAYREAIALGERLVAEEPRNSRNRSDLAFAYSGLAAVTLAADPREAERLQGKALQLAGEVSSASPKVITYKIDLASAHVGAARIAYDRHRLTEAAQELNEAIRLLRDRPATSKGTPQSRLRLVSPLTMLLRVHLDAGQKAQAEAVARQLRESLAPVEKDGILPHKMPPIAEAYEFLARSLQRSDKAQARVLYRRSLALWDELRAFGAADGIVQPHRDLIASALAFL